MKAESTTEKQQTSSLMNRAQEVDAFLTKIADEVRKGASFIPYLGSGLSVASGIPTTQNFKLYFYKLLCDALNSCEGNRTCVVVPTETPIVDTLNSRGNKRSVDGRHIDENRMENIAHTLKWPDLSAVRGKHLPTKDSAFQQRLYAQVVKTETKCCHKTREDVKDFFAHAKKLLVPSSNLFNPHPTEEKPAFTWQFGLECLARLFNERESPDANMVGLLNESVIDTFFTQIIGSRQPNFGHMMLAHLSEALRISTLLTTNFDTLIERAFENLHLSLATFDVHRNAGLPNAGLVLGKRSLIKLNGGRYGLRGDQSVNDKITPSDRKTISSYFSNTRATHLLVLGTTHNEKRTTSALQAILNKHKNVHLFWMIFDSNDVQAINKEFQTLKDKGRLHTVVHHDVGLLLVHLYQILFHSLPPAGANYPAFWRIPPYPYEKTSSVKDITKNTLKKYRQHFTDAFIELDTAINAKNPTNRLIIVDGAKGASSVCAEVWDSVVRRHHCIWLELDDFMGPGDTFICLMNELAHQVGLPAPGPFHDAPTWEQCRDEIDKCMEKAQRKCVIFLNGRDGPGHSAGWHAPEISGVARGYQPSSQWGADDVAAFWQVLRLVQKSLNPKWRGDVTVVVMVRPPPEHASRKPTLRNTADLSPNDGQPLLRPSLSKDNDETIVWIKDCIPFEPERILCSSLDWIANQAKVMAAIRVNVPNGAKSAPPERASSVRGSSGASWGATRSRATCSCS